jgi:hypothetical protein
MYDEGIGDFFYKDGRETEEMTIRGKGNEYFRHTREHESEDNIM